MNAKAAKSKKLDPIIEEKVKKVLQNAEFMNGLSEDEKTMIDDLLTKYPELKIYQNNPANLDIINKNEVVLDEIIIDNKEYYLDKNGGIWNKKANLVGICKEPNKYHMFDKDYNLGKSINFFMK